MYKTVRSSRFYVQIVEQNKGTSPHGNFEAADGLPRRFPAQRFGINWPALRETARERRAMRRAETFAVRGPLRFGGARERRLFLFMEVSSEGVIIPRGLSRRWDAAQAWRTKQTHHELIRANSQVIGNPSSGKVV
jgi:hypothetical protein